MECPNCNFEQPDERPDCARCGVIFAALQRRAERGARPRPVASSVRADEVGGLDAAGRRALGIGAVITVVLLAVPFLRFIFTPLLILVHELGHSVASWVFGYPAVPAFDFVYGGGWSLRGGRNTGLLIVVVLAFAGLGWLYQKNRRTLIVLGVAFVAWVILAATAWHQTVVAFMGHATELLVAGIFLYRGISGRSVRHSVERPLYFAFGGYMLLRVVSFAWALATRAGRRAEYERGKAGVLNDLHDVAIDLLLGLGLQLGTAGVAGILLLLCAVPPVAAWVWHRRREAIHERLASLLEREAS